MYPKKIDWEWADTPNYNDCHDQFTKEIKERADVEKLAKKLYVAEGETIYVNNVLEEAWEWVPEDVKKEYRKKAQAISNHITEGLE